MPESIKTLSFLRGRLICSYDEFSVNTYANRIIKSTMMLLLCSSINKSRKQELRKLLVFFSDVETLDLHRINWNIRINRDDRGCMVLVSVCRLVLEGLLQTQEDGTTRLMDFLDEARMCRLYERFILEYYRREFPQVRAAASRIRWLLDDGNDDMLPIMQTDVMLTHGERTLIINAKYYARTMQTHYNKWTIHSGNLYQIFTYVKNKAATRSLCGL